MQWSPEQDRALVDVARWLKSDQQVYRLFGYAGTGKTTLARHLAEGVDGTVLFGAFTGKAAYVLRQKGCPSASTLHSLIYHSKDKGRAQLLELENQLVTLRAELREQHSADPVMLDRVLLEHPRIAELERQIEQERNNIARPSFQLNTESQLKDAKLLVVDEVSMVDDRMGEDLLYFGTKILVLGDPAQLPPVYGTGFFVENCQPNTILTEIHRQARDNPIIELATRVRNKENIPLGTYGSTCKVVSDRPSPEEALAADQILVGRNKTRASVNGRVRSLKGVTEWHPVPGDKLVCLRNNHDKGLLNGAIWYSTDIGEVSKDRVIMTVDPEDGGSPTIVEAHAGYFRGEEIPFWERKQAEEFDFGNALTVHKAQGSQWDKVMLFDEAWCFRDDRYRWLYTGITRAAEELTVVRT